MTKKELIAKIHDYFADKKEVVAVYLYGSYARSEQKKESDIDLAVLFLENTADRLSLRIDYVDELYNILDRKVEIQDLNFCKVDIAYRVLYEGVLIISRNEEMRVKYEVMIMQRYFDLKPFFDEYYSVLQRQSMKGDFHGG